MRLRNRAAAGPPGAPRPSEGTGSKKDRGCKKLVLKRGRPSVKRLSGAASRPVRLDERGESALLAKAGALWHLGRGQEASAAVDRLLAINPRNERASKLKNVFSRVPERPSPQDRRPP